MTSLDIVFRAEVDRRLRSTSGYVGAFALDPGNPIHRGAFADMLNYTAAIMDGAVMQELSFEGDPDFPIRGAASFKPGGLIWKPHGWLHECGPPNLEIAPHSRRGAQSAATLGRKHARPIENRVFEAIQRAFGFASPGRPFAFEAVGKPADVLQALMPERKFTRYLFDKFHKDGKSKAKFFIDTLRIDPNDWRYLAAQFYEGLLSARLEDIEYRDWKNGYGIQFNAYIRVPGGPASRP